jgi:7,8-dihydropterin-6-yl-methyl-4-(beta-D-ribofuranosyl)aminobenzene 5'-phosphate synthase
MVEITVLADNEVTASRPKGLRGEWGFAAAVETGDGAVLFDTGQTGVVPANAARLGVDFSFESVVLSHAHYDHTGGLDAALARLDEPELYCHPSVWTPRYGENDDGSRGDFIGLPYARAAVADRAQIVEHTDPVEVVDGVVALGEIPREHDDAAIGLVETEAGLAADTVPDDQSLAIETGDGVAVVLGCGHAGLRNVVEYADDVVGEVRYVVGGTHLIGFEEPAIREVAAWLDGRLDLFAGTHCTGATAREVFAGRFPEAVESIGVGTTLEL